MLVCLLSTSEKFLLRGVESFRWHLLPDFTSLIGSKMLILVPISLEGFMAPWTADRESVASAKVFPVKVSDG
jgi:hypothetical protein